MPDYYIASTKSIKPTSIKHKRVFHLLDTKAYGFHIFGDNLFGGKWFEGCFCYFNDCVIKHNNGSFTIIGNVEENVRRTSSALELEIMDINKESPKSAWPSEEEDPYKTGQSSQTLPKCTDKSKREYSDIKMKHPDHQEPQGHL
ncbi:hypothetical protein ES703_122199 [subsurface metagenome]